MFRCSECAAEYDIKPDYCDCGNDTFEEIIAKPEPEKKPEPKIQRTPQKQNMQSLNIKKISQPAPKKLEKRTFAQRYPELERLKKSLDPISVLIFTFCIILSFVVIFCLWNSKSQITNDTVKEETASSQIQDIPSLESFWNNSVEGVVSDSSKQVQQKPEEEKKEEDNLFTKIMELPKQIELPKVVNNSVQQQVFQPTAQKQQPLQPAKPVVSKPKTIITSTQNLPKTQTKTQTQTQTKQPVVNSPDGPQNAQYSALAQRIQNNLNNSQTTNKTQTQTQTQSKSQTTQSTQTNQTKPTAPIPQTTSNTNSSMAQTVKNSTVQTNTSSKSTVATQTINTAAAKQELANYKASLRNAIGKKINFERVVGDGNCTLTFKIDSSGKLVNRAFAQQSSNITLNDAVYSAMMSLPSFNPPPSAYKNETLRLYIKFYNGNFEISLN